jgi:hypothetical protein
LVLVVVVVVVVVAIVAVIDRTRLLYVCVHIAKQFALRRELKLCAADCFTFSGLFSQRTNTLPCILSRGNTFFPWDTVNKSTSLGSLQQICIFPIGPCGGPLAVNSVVSKGKCRLTNRYIILNSGAQELKDNYGIPGEPNRVRRWGFSANL